MSYLCLTVPPVAALGATVFVGDLPPDPTVVELGGAGCKDKKKSVTLTISIF